MRLAAARRRRSGRSHGLLALDDACIPALGNLASIHFLRKDHPRAIELCLRVLEIAPRLHQVRVNLGRAYRLSGRREKAAEERKRVLKETPDAPDALGCLRELGGQEAP